MTKYYPYGVSLSKGQLKKLSRAYNNNSPITIRLARNELSGPHELMLTKTQINHRGPTQSVCVADCYFIVNVLDLPFASPIAIYR